MENRKKILVIIVSLFFFLNLVFLDYKIFFKTKNPEPELSGQEVKDEAPTTFLEKEIKSCPASCLEKIKEATASISLKPQEKVTEKTIEKQTQTKVETAAGPKEFFVPLDGSGSTTEGGFKDIAGMEGYIDREKYPGKITVLWEASLRIKDGNGEAHARLFNVTKNVAVDYSEITSIGGEFKRVTSNNISLASGSNLYRIQMFSTTQYEVFIQGARVKITIE